MAASSSSEGFSASTVLDNKEQASSLNLAHVSTAVSQGVQGDVGEQEQIGDVAAVQDPGPQMKLSHQCKRCNRSFSRADNLKAHMLNKHLDSSVFCCNACGKLFKTSESLEKHLTNNYCPFQCDLCAKTFKQKVRLDHHKQVCTDVKFVHKECNICGKLFKRKIDYERHKNHLKEHDGSYRFFCHWCGVRCCTFEMLQQLHSDMKIDTPHIRKSFEGETEKTRWWERSKAMAKKNEDDPESDDSSHKLDELKCEYCGARFSWKKDLKKHQKEIFSSPGVF